MSASKQETITFKADSELARLLAVLPNKSEFYRQAILNALDNACPLCQGSGILTPQQKRHWDEFLAHHHLEKCNDCDALHVVCESESEGHMHG